jgi:hypothetical protein
MAMPDDGVVGILAGKFHTLNHVAFIVNFTLLQVCIIFHGNPGLS